MKRFIVPLQVVVTVSDQPLLMRATKEQSSCLEWYYKDLTYTAAQLRCYSYTALYLTAAMLETQSIHVVESYLVKEFRYCSPVLPAHVQ